MDAIEAIQTRRSVRAYYLKPVAREVLTEIIDCARLAPTGMNLQPWEFVVVTSPETITALAGLCTNAPFMAEAAAVVVVACRKQGMWLEDAAAATTTLMLAARAHGLGSCWYHMLDKPFEPDMRALVGLPDDLAIVCCVTLGHGENPPSPDKRPLADVLHWETYG
jgi:nitroreductase